MDAPSRLWAALRLIPGIDFAARSARYARVATIGLLLTCLSAQAQVIDFTGPYSPATWTTTFLGSIQGSTIATSSTLSIIGGDAGCPGGTAGVIGPCEIRYATSIIQNPFSFHWVYASSDARGPADDIFGILVDGVRSVLSDSSGSLTQAGDLLVNASTSFGWFINCTDCTQGGATVTISQFRAGIAALPEPTHIALLALLLAIAFGTGMRPKTAAARRRLVRRRRNER